MKIAARNDHDVRDDHDLLLVSLIDEALEIDNRLSRTVISRAGHNIRQAFVIAGPLHTTKRSVHVSVNTNMSLIVITRMEWDVRPSLDLVASGDAHAESIPIGQIDHARARIVAAAREYLLSAQ